MRIWKGLRIYLILAEYLAEAETSLVLLIMAEIKDARGSEIRRPVMQPDVHILGVCQSPFLSAIFHRIATDADNDLSSDTIN